jgi:hypothetical protein
MELRAILDLVEAPADLVAWAPKDLGEAVERCPRGSWLAWIMGTTGLPIEHLFAAVAEVVREALVVHGATQEPLFDALDASLDLLDGDEDGGECLAIAEECETLASQPPVGYRAGASPSFSELATAASQVAHAAEGYQAASTRAWALAEALAVHRSALIGVASFVFMPQDLRLVFDPDQFAVDRTSTDVLYVVAALASAMEHVERAGAQSGGPGADDQSIQARAATASRLRELITFRE